MANQELQTRYGIRAQEYQTMQNVILNNPEAGIKIGDSMEVATKKLADQQVAVRDRENAKFIETLMVNNPRAGIQKGDSVEVATQKMADQQEQDLKDMEKKDLQNMAMSVGVSSKGSTRELRNRIRKANKKNIKAQIKLVEQQIESNQMKIERDKKALTDTTDYKYTTDDNQFGFYNGDKVQPVGTPTKPETPAQQTRNSVYNFYPNIIK
jgi:hypothetical protein